MSPILLCAFLFLGVSLTWAKPQENSFTTTEVQYSGYQLIRVECESNSDGERLREVVESLEIETWTEIQTSRPVDLFVPPSLTSTIKRFLSGWNVTTLIDDFGKIIQREKRNLATLSQDIDFQQLLDNEDDDDDFHRSYHSYEQVERWLWNKAEKNPSLATFVDSIGYSVGNRRIFAFVVSSQVHLDRKKPIILVNSLFHSREWIGGSTALFLVDKLIENYDNDIRIKQLVDKYEWHFIPIANPDGYEITWTRDRLWRGNSRNIDNNRNFDLAWKHFCGLKASDGCSGNKAFSEPETKAIANYIWQLKTSIKAIFDLHAYSELWMWPYGSQSAPSPLEEQLRVVSEKAVAAIENVHGMKFKHGPIYKTIYKVTGDGIDWAHSVAGIPFPFAIECRPAFKKEGGFVVDPSHIIPSGQEISAGILTAVEEITKLLPSL